MTLTISLLILALFIYRREEASPWYLTTFILLPILSYFDFRILKFLGDVDSLYLIFYCALAFLLGLALAIDFKISKALNLGGFKESVMFLGMLSLYNANMLFLATAIMLVTNAYVGYLKRGHTKNPYWFYIFLLFPFIVLEKSALRNFLLEIGGLSHSLALMAALLFIFMFEFRLLLAAFALVLGLTLFSPISNLVLNVFACILLISIFINQCEIVRSWIDRACDQYAAYRKIKTLNFFANNRAALERHHSLKEKAHKNGRNLPHVTANAGENILLQQAIIFSIFALGIVSVAFMVVANA